MQKRGGSMVKLGSKKTLLFVSIVCALTAIDSPAQTVTILATFDGANGQ
jgi:hypothetical protein